MKVDWSQVLEISEETGVESKKVAEVLSYFFEIGEPKQAQIIKHWEL